MATRKRSKTLAPKAAKRSKSAKRGAKVGSSYRFKGFFLPLFLSFCILVCLSALGILGYRTVTASNFFSVGRVSVVGTNRASRDDIERIAATQAERSGAWNADLDEIKARLEKLAFVRSASVSRALPNELRISISEHLPVAVVQTARGEFLVNEEAEILAPAETKDESMPFAMTGWDEAKSEKATKDNIQRIKIYRKMLTEWREFDLASRVNTVDLADIRDPRAFTEDSGLKVSIAVGPDNFAEHLKKGISAIVGKGGTFEGVELVGANMILTPRQRSK
jgi:cell division septal protein FtsQ